MHDWMGPCQPGPKKKCAEEPLISCQVRNRWARQCCSKGHPRHQCPGRPGRMLLLQCEAAGQPHTGGCVDRGECLWVQAAALQRCCVVWHRAQWPTLRC